jgi:hypothetical protein
VPELIEQRLADLEAEVDVSCSQSIARSLYPIWRSARMDVIVAQLTLFSMQVTLDLSDELAQALTQQADRLPELLAQALTQPAIPARTYRHVLEFLTSHPTAEQITNFRPTQEMTDRLKVLLSRNQTDTLTTAEVQELDEFEQIEHLIVMLKSSNLSYLQSAA